MTYIYDSEEENDKQNYALDHTEFCILSNEKIIDNTGTPKQRKWWCYEQGK